MLRFLINNMSRIGKLPIPIPAGVQVQVSDKNMVSVKGPKGELSRAISMELTVNVDDSQIAVAVKSDTKRARALHGLSRTLINNMVIGVTTGYSTTQELVGVGYRANANGQILELALGYSHEIAFQLPNEVKVTTETLKGKNPTIKLECNDKELLGMVAAKIRSLRKPEPYKGKGIKFAGEVLRRKAGKSASKK